MSQTLSAADVNRLMTDPSGSVRAETAAKIAGSFDQKTLNDSERRIAEDIFRSLVKDTEQKVREALSAHLKTSPDVPHDIAVALAQDVEAVSLPMLQSSEVLTDDDLIEILRGQSEAKQVAIAQRSTVSARIADAVVDTGNETAVARLVSNEGADLNEGTLDRVMTDYQESAAISESLSRRTNLPAAVQERLVSVLTEKMQAALADGGKAPVDQVTNMLLQARERATVGLLKEGSSEEELQRLVEQMHVNGRLTASIILRSLAMGDIAFFEMAIAHLGRVPVQNGRILIHDQGRLGFKSLYERAGLPDRLFPAFRAGVDVASENEYDGGPNDRARYVSRMVERMLTRSEDPSEGIGDEDIDYLIGKLSQLAA